MPPPPKDPPKQPEADWDDVLGEAKSSGISPEMARTLLQMNPKMREEGKNTAWVVASGQQAATKGARVQAESAKQAAPKQGEGDLYTSFDDIKRKLELDENELEQQVKLLQQQKLQAKADALESAMRAIMQKDPEMLSPMTQQALADRKAFLDRLGFSVKTYVDFKRNKMGSR
jgi:hypothetical protein